MFSQACVKNSVHGGGVYPSMHWGRPPSPPPTATAVDGTHPTGMLSCYCPQMKFAKVMFFHVSVCPQGGGVSQHVLQVVSPQLSCRSWGVGGDIPTCLAGGVPACLALVGFPGPHPRGKLRGLARGVSRPTPRGSPGPHPGEVSRPTPRGGLQAHTQGRSPGPHQWGVVYPSMHWGRPPPFRGRLLPRAVRILLECILVRVCVCYLQHNK